jgi:predicted component of type VI protein secretion system
MKVRLVVLTPGKQEGKVVPIPQGEFHIGRDPECQLRPTNPVVSKRHCTLLTRGEQFFVVDLKSTNGTYVNDVRISGERELAEGDQLKIGPLHFCVHIEKSVGVERPTPLPPSKAWSPAADDLDAIAAELLGAQDGPAAPGDGTTVLMEPVLVSQETPALDASAAGAKSKGAKAVPEQDSSTAAKALLDKYMTRRKGAR